MADKRLYDTMTRQLWSDHVSITTVTSLLQNCVL